jgi:AraC family transcriptional regulator
MLVQHLPTEAYPDAMRKLVWGIPNDSAAPEHGSHCIRITFAQISISISVTRPSMHELPDADLLVVSRIDRSTTRNGLDHGGNSAQVWAASTFFYDLLDKLQGPTSRANVLLVDLRVVRDPIIKRLALALIGADDVEQGLGMLYADAVCLALVARLLGTSCPTALPMGRGQTALSKWRLKRVVAYIDAHLAERIKLADLARVSGLSRMYFAAQFRLATGVRPHEYVLQRRIERAQELLRSPGAALVDVAMSVGFQTQSHFSTVFRRFVDETPHRWRRAAVATL